MPTNNHWSYFESKLSTQGAKIRVTDLVQEQDLESRRDNINVYDKKMSTVLTCLAYEAALTEQSADLEQLEQMMFEILDEGVESYETVILSGLEKLKVLKRSYLTQDILKTETWLTTLKSEILALKNTHQISRELIEMAFLKMAMMADFAISQEYVFLNFSSEQIDKILSLPLENVKEIKKAIGGSISSPALYPAYPDVEKIMPVFSKSGTMGFNTILFALSKGFLPVGYGSEPYPVHIGYHASEPVWTTQHDYGHALLRVHQMMQNSPTVFQSCMKAYTDLIEKKQHQLIDDLTFKKDLIAIFFIVFEVAFNPGQDLSVKDYILKRTRAPRFEGIDVEKEASDKLKLTVFEVFDFASPLRALGYQIPGDSDKSWEAADGLRAAFLDIYKGFSSRHPEIQLKPDKKIPNEIDKTRQYFEKLCRYHPQTDALCFTVHEMATAEVLNRSRLDKLMSLSTAHQTAIRTLGKAEILAEKNFELIAENENPDDLAETLKQLHLLFKDFRAHIQTYQQRLGVQQYFQQNGQPARDGFTGRTQEVLDQLKTLQNTWSIAGIIEGAEPEGASLSGDDIRFILENLPLKPIPQAEAVLESLGIRLTPDSSPKPV